MPPCQPAQNNVFQRTLPRGVPMDFVVQEGSKLVRTVVVERENLSLLM